MSSLFEVKQNFQNIWKLNVWKRLGRRTSGLEVHYNIKSLLFQAESKTCSLKKMAGPSSEEVDEKAH